MSLLDSLPPPALLLIGGFVLFWASDRFVAHAAHLARSLRVPNVVIGAVVLGFGTSLPELLVSAGAVWEGSPGAAIGNVVGSNIANVGLILGTAAMIAPIRVGGTLIRHDLPVGALAAVALTSWVMYSGDLGHTVGLTLLVAFAVYLTLLLSNTHRHRRDNPVESIAASEAVSHAGGDDPAVRSVGKDVAWTVAGGLLVAIGAKVFVMGARGTAQMFGVPDEVIALSLMAVGTSLPEFATTLAACRKGETDLAIGNVAGSNVFNLLLVLGVCATAFDLPVSAVMAHTDFPAMTLAAVLAFPVLSRSGHINRFQGSLLVFLYLIYTVWIFTHERGAVPL